MKWKHVTPITHDKGEVIAAKLPVCLGDSEEYFTFIPEAYPALKDWMDFRKQYGEEIMRPINVELLMVIGQKQVLDFFIVKGALVIFRKKLCWIESEHYRSGIAVSRVT